MASAVPPPPRMLSRRSTIPSQFWIFTVGTASVRSSRSVRTWNTRSAPRRTVPCARPGRERDRDGHVSRGGACSSRCVGLGCGLPVLTECD